MITDPVFYRLFETSPETFFLVLGLPADAARDMAARYQYEALEFKTTAHRLDGVFLPKEAGLPLYFLEVQFYPLANVFAGLLAKIFTFLKQHDPAQPYVGVVLFDTRAQEPEALGPYQPLMDAGFIRRYYLDEMPEVGQRASRFVDPLFDSPGGKPGPGNGARTGRAGQARNRRCSAAGRFDRID